MLTVNLPRKLMAQIQVGISALLIVLAVIFSFTPIIKIKITDADMLNDVKTTIGEVTEHKANLDGLVFPDELGVTSPKLIGSIKLLVNVVKVTVNSAKKASSGDMEGASSITSDLQKTVLNDDGTLKEETKDSILIVAALAVTIKDAIMSDTKDSNSNNSTIGTILNILVMFMATMYVLLFTLLAPFIYIIIALTALIPAIKSIKDPTVVSAKVSRKLPGMIQFPLMLMLFQCVIPGMSFGIGATMLFVLSLVSACVNVVFTRLRTYDKQEGLYSLIVQGASILSIVGFIVFFTSLLKTGVFVSFIKGQWGVYVANVAIAKAANATIASNGYIVDAILILVSVLLAIISIDYISKVLRRISLSAKRKKTGGVEGNFIVYAILLILVGVLPKVVVSLKHNYPSVTSTAGDPTSFLILSSQQSSAVTGVIIGAVLMILSEIALLVLQNVFCKDMKREDCDAVLTGTAKSAEEKLEAARKIVEGAQADAAVQETAATETAPSTEEPVVEVVPEQPAPEETVEKQE